MFELGFKKLIFQLEQNEGCQYDAIFVRDTNGSELHKLCGENQANIEVVFFTFTNQHSFLIFSKSDFQVTSTGNLLTLELKSDSVQVKP